MKHVFYNKGKLIISIFGRIIKQKRLNTNKSQRLISDEFGIPKSLLNRIENGKSEVKIISIFTICEMLEIKPSEVFKEIENSLPLGYSLFDN